MAAQPFASLSVQRLRPIAMPHTVSLFASWIAALAQPVNRSASTKAVKAVEGWARLG